MDETLIGETLPESFILYFAEIEDPRIDRGKLHPLINIIVIALCAIICGADAWTEVEKYGKMKEVWLKKYLSLSNGIPSHDTFGRVFSALDPILLRTCFVEWMEEVLQLTKDAIIAIDGKTVRRSHDKANDKKALHMVSAFASKVGLVLSQIKTNEKSNEITAIPQLLDTFDIKGCIITIDAMGCQTNIAQKIISKDADYILALKGNQGNLKKDVDDYFEFAQQKKFQDILHDFAETIEKSHGRIEERRCWVVDDVNWLAEQGHEWAKLKSIVLVESVRIIKNVKTTEKRTYISSLNGNAKRINDGIRKHWAIENKLHWILDMDFREDECRVRKDHSPENFVVLRHIAQNIIKMDHTKNKKCSLRARRKMAGWNDNYLAELIFGETNVA